MFRRLQAEAVAGFVRHLAKGWKLHVNIETLATATKAAKEKALNLFFNVFISSLRHFYSPHSLSMFMDRLRQDVELLQGFCDTVLDEPGAIHPQPLSGRLNHLQKPRREIDCNHPIPRFLHFLTTWNPQQ
jgi:hypothetical protein